jgi:hypothetical protein
VRPPNLHARVACQFAFANATRARFGCRVRPPTRAPNERGLASILCMPVSLLRCDVAFATYSASNRGILLCFVFLATPTHRCCRPWQWAAAAMTRLMWGGAYGVNGSGAGARRQRGRRRWTRAARAGSGSIWAPQAGTGSAVKLGCAREPLALLGSGKWLMRRVYTERLPRLDWLRTVDHAAKCIMWLSMGSELARVIAHNARPTSSQRGISERCATESQTRGCLTLILPLCHAHARTLAAPRAPPHPPAARLVHTCACGAVRSPSGPFARAHACLRRPMFAVLQDHSLARPPSGLSKTWHVQARLLHTCPLAAGTPARRSCHCTHLMPRTRPSAALPARAGLRSGVRRSMHARCGELRFVYSSHCTCVY